MTRNLKTLIFDCLCLTEGLITFLLTTDGEGSVFNSSSTTFVWPLYAAW